MYIYMCIIKKCTKCVPVSGIQCRSVLLHVNQRTYPCPGVVHGYCGWGLFRLWYNGSILYQLIVHIPVQSIYIIILFVQILST